MHAIWHTLHTYYTQNYAGVFVCLFTDVENVQVELTFVQGSPCISVTWDVSFHTVHTGVYVHICTIHVPTSKCLLRS